MTIDGLVEVATFFGVLFVFIGLKKSAARWNNWQKIGLLLLVLSLVPFGIGFVQGFIAGISGH